MSEAISIDESGIYSGDRKKHIEGKVFELLEACSRENGQYYADGVDKKSAADLISMYIIYLLEKQERNE